NILITPIDYPGQKNVRHAIIDRIINGDQSSVPSQILNIVPLI
ncbi:16406_t:CDS:1, partial [Funneliformis geosporum]